MTIDDFSISLELETHEESKRTMKQELLEESLQAKLTLKEDKQDNNEQDQGQGCDSDEESDRDRGHGQNQKRR